MSDFVHLHCHSEHSLDDSVIRVEGLCARAKELGFTSAALTDYRTLRGAFDLERAARSVGVKPIFGLEFGVVQTSVDDFDERSVRPPFRIVLLAQNLAGYRNLFLRDCRSGWGVDKRLLAKHSEGVIALSGGLRGEIPRRLAAAGEGGGMDSALAAARDYASIYPGCFYLELQSNGLALQERTNEQLIDIAERLRLPLVATNDCRCLGLEDASALDDLRRVEENSSWKKFDKLQIPRRDAHELYYKSAEQMRAAFAHIPEAIANTARIAAECNVTLPRAQRRIPRGVCPWKRVEMIDRALRNGR